MNKTRRSTRSAPSPSGAPATSKSSPPRRKAPAKAPAAGPAAAAASPVAGARRKWYVLVSLMGVMTLTSALLVAVKRDPLVPDTSVSLMAADSTDAVFDTPVPAKAGRWKYVFVHHSRTPGGSAAALAEAAGSNGPMPDHFVIGNGDGCGDGEIQVGHRWAQQQPAGRTPGVDRMDPACVSICLIGDFDRTPPTPAQMRRLGQLVASLQGRLRIGREQVWVADAKASPAGVGRHFPGAAFRQQLTP